MLNQFWPIRLKTPHFVLGSSFAEGLRELQKLGSVVEETTEKDGHSARLDTLAFSVAVYEKDERIKAVWYDDPSGRKTFRGRCRKTDLYLERYWDNGDWEQTMDDGCMVWWFNKKEQRALVYGRHAYVIRVNDQRDFENNQLADDDWNAPTVPGVYGPFRAPLMTKAELLRKQQEQQETKIQAGLD